jgi:hypothetical protein
VRTLVTAIVYAMEANTVQFQKIATRDKSIHTALLWKHFFFFFFLIISIPVEMFHRSRPDVPLCTHRYRKSWCVHCSEERGERNGKDEEEEMETREERQQEEWEEGEDKAAE